VIAGARLRALLWPVRVEKDIHCEYDLSLPLPDWPEPEGFTIRVGTPDEIMRAADMRLGDGNEHLHREYQDRVRRGQKCFIVLRDGEVVGCDWLAFRSDHEGPVRIVLRDDEALCMDAFVAISARGRSVHSAVHRAMVVWAKQHGYRRAYTFLRFGDPAAAKAIDRMGWVRGEHPRYTIVSSPMARLFGVRHQLVIDHEPGRHPIPRGRWFRVPPFERESWEQAERIAPRLLSRPKARAQPDRQS